MKRSRSYKRYTLVSEHDAGVRHWSVSGQRLFALLSVSVVVIASILFLSAEFLTDSLYKVQAASSKDEYKEMESDLAVLKAKMESLSGQVTDIEAKDKALRTYAGIPEIDADVRKVGIGGIRLSTAENSGDIRSELETKISSLQMDLDKLSRKIKLELKSYVDIYDRVSQDADQLGSVPSISPVTEGYLNSRFGYRNDPFTGKSRFHYGQDFAVNTGTRIYAPADGIIKYVGREGGFGKVIKIDHGVGYRTIYAHLSHYAVKKGQRVERGDYIGKSGNSGRSAGPHLHYEIHRNGQAQNPLNYIFTGHLK